MEENKPKETPAPFEPGQPKQNFWQRNGVTIFTVAILGLIIGGAIAINQRRVSDEIDQGDVSILTNQNATSTPQVTVTTNPTTTPDVEVTENKSSDVKTPIAVNTQPEGEQGGVVASGENTEREPSGTVLGTADGKSGTITVTAIRGNGRTHLARRAIAERLQDTNQSLTAAQKIYAEDYLTKKYTPKVKIKPGQTMTYTVDQVNEAISSSLDLSTGQIKNLQKYTSAAHFSAP